VIDSLVRSRVWVYFGNELNARGGYLDAVTAREEV
jgi:hypothetical protein